MKKYLVFVLAALLVGALATGVLAARKSNVGHLYLYEKDSNWDIVSPGAWGKMKYNLSGPEFKFVFNGHGLEPGEDYCLIYYPDPWPGNGLICLGEGTANMGGNVHIAGSVDPNGDLPIPSDIPEPLPAQDGAKIWLVLSDDVDCVNKHFKNVWNPTEYLFEYEVITFDDTDD